MAAPLDRAAVPPGSAAAQQAGKHIEWLYDGDTATSLLAEQSEQYLLGRALDAKVSAAGDFDAVHAVSTQLSQVAGSKFLHKGASERNEGFHLSHEDPIAAMRIREEEAQRCLLANPVLLAKLRLLRQAKLAAAAGAGGPQTVDFRPGAPATSATVSGSREQPTSRSERDAPVDPLAEHGRPVDSRGSDRRSMPDHRMSDRHGHRHAGDDDGRTSRDAGPRRGQHHRSPSPAARRRGSRSRSRSARRHRGDERSRHRGERRDDAEKGGRHDLAGRSVEGEGRPRHGSDGRARRRGDRDSDEGCSRRRRSHSRERRRSSSSRRSSHRDDRSRRDRASRSPQPAPDRRASASGQHGSDRRSGHSYRSSSPAGEDGGRSARYKGVRDERGPEGRTMDTRSAGGVCGEPRAPAAPLGVATAVSAAALVRPGGGAYGLRLPGGGDGAGRDSATDGSVVVAGRALGPSADMVARRTAALRQMEAAGGADIGGAKAARAARALLEGSAAATSSGSRGSGAAPAAAPLDSTQRAARLADMTAAAHEHESAQRRRLQAASAAEAAEDGNAARRDGIRGGPPASRQY